VETTSEEAASSAQPSEAEVETEAEAHQLEAGDNVQIQKGKYKGQEGELVSVGARTGRVRIFSTGKTTGNVQLADMQ